MWYCTHYLYPIFLCRMFVFYKLFYELYCTYCASWVFFNTRYSNNYFLSFWSILTPLIQNHPKQIGLSELSLNYEIVWINWIHQIQTCDFHYNISICILDFVHLYLEFTWHIMCLKLAKMLAKYLTVKYQVLCRINTRNLDICCTVYNLMPFLKPHLSKATGVILIELNLHLEIVWNILAPPVSNL